VGVLAPAHDAHTFAHALVQMARADRPALRAKAADHFRKHLTYEVIGQQLRAAYQSVLA
jgi:glycosyltransferase involved in cell wall biosynthesis